MQADATVAPTCIDIIYILHVYDDYRGGSRGGSKGGGAHPASAPPKIGKNMIFWRKIVIFHTKYPNNFRASLHSALFFKVPPPPPPPPPNLKSWMDYIFLYVS